VVTWIWILGSLYALLLVGAAYTSWRQTETEEDYLLAGSSIGVFAGVLTYAATLFSTFMLMGMPDFFRNHGVGGWIFLAVSDGAQIFLVVWFGYHLRKRSRELGFRGTSGLLNGLTSTRMAGYVFMVGVFLFLIPYVAIQIRGLAIFLEAVFPGALPMWGWSGGILVAMLVYSEVGGLRAIILSDIIQGLTLLAVVWIVGIGCLNYFGGVEAMFEQARATDEALLSTPGPKGLFTPQFLLASFFGVLLIPATQPQITTRLAAMDSRAKMNRMTVSIGGFVIAIMLPVVAIGIYGAVEYAGATSREFWANVLLYEQADIVAAAAVVGLLTAAMSTADSQLFALGTEVRSLYRGDSEDTALLLTRIAVVVFGVVAFVFSLFSGDQFALLAVASFRGTAMLGPLVLSAVLVRSRRAPGAEVPVATALALALFLGSLAGIVPSTVGPVRLDLLLLGSLALIAVASVVMRRRGNGGRARGQRPAPADAPRRAGGRETADSSSGTGTPRPS
jgi:SSS family solute:Na+ symporter